MPQTITRRNLLLGSAGALAVPATLKSSRLAVEAYIFQQYAEREKRTLREVLPDVFAMVSQAGFRNIELNPEFFTPACVGETLGLVRKYKLEMPSVYSGGALHSADRADATIKQALSIARLCKPFSCHAVVCNAEPKGAGVEKTDSELRIQAEQMNRMGELLRNEGFELRIHNHTPEMVSGAREWRYTLNHTRPELVDFCLDIDWVYQGNQNPLHLLKEAGNRVRELHVRSAKDKLWLEDVEAGDVDYSAIATYLEHAKLTPLLVVELAYRPQTIITRSLAEDLRRSRQYTESVFGVKA